MFFPRNADFYHLFDSQMRQLIEANTVLQSLERTKDLAVAAQSIKTIEQRADSIEHEVYLALNRTFITPIDREEIVLLANRLDDVVDATDLAINHLVLYRVDPTTRELIGYYRLLDKAVHEVGKAIAELKVGQRDHYQTMLKHCEIIDFIENQVDDHNRQSLGDLINDSRDPIAVIKLKDIYDELEGIADACGNVAKVLKTIVVKNQ